MPAGTSAGPLNACAGVVYGSRPEHRQKGRRADETEERRDTEGECRLPPDQPQRPGVTLREDKQLPLDKNGRESFVADPAPEVRKSATLTRWFSSKSRPVSFLSKLIRTRMPRSDARHGKVYRSFSPADFDRARSATSGPRQPRVAAALSAGLGRGDSAPHVDSLARVTRKKPTARFLPSRRGRFSSPICRRSRRRRFAWATGIVPRPLGKSGSILVAGGARYLCFLFSSRPAGSCRHYRAALKKDVTYDLDCYFNMVDPNQPITKETNSRTAAARSRPHPRNLDLYEATVWMLGSICE
jgi:hypothetical protein